VAYHDFQGITVVDSEKEDLVNSLGAKNHLIMRNHGLLTCGRSIPEMFVNMALLDRSCQIQAAADATGRPLVDVSQEIAKKSEELLKVQMTSMGDAVPGEHEFNAMARLVDKQDDSYKDL